MASNSLIDHVCTDVMHDNFTFQNFLKQLSFMKELHSPTKKK